MSTKLNKSKNKMNSNLSPTPKPIPDDKTVIDATDPTPKPIPDDKPVIDATDPTPNPINDNESNLLSIDNLKKTDVFKNYKFKQTQKEYYANNNSPEEILKIVDLESKPFGSFMENLIIDIFKLGKRTSSQNDATFNKKKIEIKSARYWSGETDCKWQHLEPEHDYEYVLFVLLDFQSIKVWGINKKQLMGKLRTEKIVTSQGKQGFWTCKDKIIKYLTPITNLKELEKLMAEV